ncbi:MAG TPA: deoxyribose-phosphate aldolase, partial [Gammaproteobacteria bacterium]|nr:deoxyribose-phosphate aldolase [Gammaproteobacteria bacterium]
VILETGAFPGAALIQTAASQVIDAGADFVKTSTGKFNPGATLEAAQAILSAIKCSSKPVGLKVAGGVRTLEQAEAYFKLAQQVLGQNWPTPQTFRIGSSRIGA